MRLNTATLKTDSASVVVILDSALGTDYLVDQFEAQGFEVERVDGVSLDSLKKWKAPKNREWYSHPGWTDWGQRPEWAQLVQKMGGTPIGPSTKVINLFSHLINFLAQAEKHQIPSALAHPYPLASIHEAEQVIKEYPVVLKNLRSPQFGLGLVDIASQAELKSKGALWLDHLNDLDGDAFFGVEKFVEGAKLIRLPFSRDGEGSLKFFSSVDHSLQSEYRAYIPICPTQNLSQEFKIEIEKKMASFLKAIDFRGMGSMDFLVDGSRYYLVGGHCGFKRDSWLWEKIDGVSPVKEQLRSLGIQNILTTTKRSNEKKESVAAMVFLRAEDPIYQLPAPGKIFEKDTPKGTGEWVWANLKNNIVTHQDSDLIGVWIGQAKALKELLRFAEADLSQLWLHGSLLTNQKYLIDVLKHAWVKEGAFYLGFLQHEFIPDHRPPLEVIQFAADLCAGLQKSKSAQRWLILGYKLTTDEGKKMSSPGTKKFPDLEDTLPYSAYRVTDERWSVRIGPWSFWCVEQVSVKGQLKLGSLVSGVVRRLGVQKGKIAKPGDSLAIVESLRRWVSHQVAIPIRVLTWKVKVGSEVEPGQMLAEIEKS
jgi:pyruvate carboxylase